MINTKIPKYKLKVIKLKLKEIFKINFWNKDYVLYKNTNGLYKIIYLW